MTPEEWRIAFLSGYEHGFDMTGFLAPGQPSTSSLEDRLDGLADQTYAEWVACEKENPGDRRAWALRRMSVVPESLRSAFRRKVSDATQVLAELISPMFGGEKA